jgi:hypothetical protein
LRHHQTGTVVVMAKSKLHNVGRHLSNLIRDRARAGILPQALQGDLRGTSAIPLDFDHNRRALGVVIGLPRDQRDAVASAFPEWDFLFATNKADPEQLISDCGRLGATVIIGPNVRRRHLTALRSAGMSSLSLSPAPMPRLRTAKGVARGFTLEPQTSWIAARRMSELDVMFAHRNELLGAELRWEATEIARHIGLDPPPKQSFLMIDPESGPWRLTDAEKDDVYAAAGGTDVVPFPMAHGRFWDDETLDRFEDGLQRSWALVSKKHPLAFTSTFWGYLPAEKTKAFVSGFVLTYANSTSGGFAGAELGSDATIHADVIDRIAIGILIASRYVHEGVLVDPVAFVRDEPLAFSQP